MNRISLILIIVSFIFFSGCINSNPPSDIVNSSGNENPFTQEPKVSITPVHTVNPTFNNSNITEPTPKIKSNDLMVVTNS